LAQVEGFIDDVGFRLNVHLESEGYTTPVTVVADKNTFNWLKAANNSGAAARVLSALPAESWTDPDNEGTAQSRRNGLEQEVSRIIKAIKERALPAARADVDTDDFIMGSQLDEDGLTKLPMFTRGQFDYPGTRTLAE